MEETNQGIIQNQNVPISFSRSPRIRWSAETAGAILDSWRAGGLSLRAFSRDNGIGYQRLLAWRRKLDRDKAGEFVRIDVSHGSFRDIEISLTNGRVARFGVGTDPRYVKLLLDVIER